MNVKAKNDPSRYVTRASLAGAPIGNARVPVPSQAVRQVQESKNALGTLDKRWYMQLPKKG